MFGRGGRDVASVEELYRQAWESVARVPTPELDSDTRRVWVLIGALSDAFWRRAGEPGFSVLDHLARNAREYRAESADEVAIWDELTAPHNYPAVARYVEQRRGQASDSAVGLHTAILEAARRRLEGEGRA